MNVMDGHHMVMLYKVFQGANLCSVGIYQTPPDPI